MNDSSGPDTIFYTLKLKRTKRPIDVFEKMSKSIKKKGATKKWSFFIDEDNQIFQIDFGDSRSETFVLSFNEKKICEGFCKVYFPINGELFENEKKSEFKALLNMIWLARNMFSQMDISDDYGQAVDFMESKKYKLVLRELTEDEKTFAHELFDSGITNYPDFIMAVVRKGLEMPPEEKWYEHINVKVPYGADNLNDKINCMWGFFETYVYETAEYKGERVMYNSDYSSEFSGLWFSVAAFTFIADEIYRFRNYFRCNDNVSFGVKHAQIRRYYKDKIYPLLDSMPNGFEKCCLAYRFFLSAYDFCGFKFVGKEKDIEDYRYVLVE